MRNINKNLGFTLIELLVVVAIIALLTSIAMIALISARQKARNTDRVANMVQMNNALALYFNSNRGYPSGTAGIPNYMTPTFLSKLPVAPIPGDGVCDGAVHTSDSCTAADAACTNVPVNNFYYIASGTPQSGFYPDYAYYFCIGQTTSGFAPGVHVLTPSGVK